MAKKSKRKYKPLTRKAKFRLALVIAAGILILALLVGILVMGIRGIASLMDGSGDGEQPSEPVTSQNIDTEPLASVILDPGHGGSDGGTVGNLNGREIVEKDIDFAITLKVKALLEEENIEVILTREDDVDMDLKERTAFANQTDADLFVSLRCNYFEGEEADEISGVEAYYEKDKEGSKELAEAILNAADASDMVNVRELRTEMMYVVRFTDMPSTLIEMGFLSNEEELRKLVTGSYQQDMAEVIAEGILDALNLEEGQS